MARPIFYEQKKAHENAHPDLVIISQFGKGAPWSKEPEKEKWHWIATRENAEQAIEEVKRREGHFRVTHKRTRKVLFEK